MIGSAKKNKMQGSLPLFNEAMGGGYYHTSTGTPLAVPDVPFCRAISITGLNNLLLLKAFVLSSHFAELRSLIDTESFTPLRDHFKCRQRTTSMVSSIA